MSAAGGGGRGGDRWRSTVVPRVQALQAETL